MQRGKDDASGDGGAMPQEGGLRARFRKRKAATESHVEFGVAQANAYFNARRIKRGKKKATTQTRKQSADRGAGVKSAKAKRGQAGAGSGSDGEGPEEEEDEKKLVLPSRGEVLTALKQADDREAERRAANAKYTLPRFEQVCALGASASAGGRDGEVARGCRNYAVHNCPCSTSHSGAVSFLPVRICCSMALAPSSRCFK